MSNTLRPRRFRWPTLVRVIVLLLFLGAVAATLVARQLLVQPDTEVQAIVDTVVAVERGDLVELVSVNGSLAPRDQARVRFPEGQRVRELLVARGDTVAAGAILARLETRDLELKVTSARAELDQAQRNLTKLLTGPSEAELARAAATVARARAEAATYDQTVSPLDREVAQSRLEAARQRIADLETGVATDDISAAERSLASAESALVEAQLSLERTRDSASRAKTDAYQAMMQGITTLERTQRDYSDAFWDWDFVRRTGRHPTEQNPPDEFGRIENRLLTEREIEGFRRRLLDAEVTLRSGDQSLANLNAAYDQARTNEVRDIQTAERAITGAERSVTDAARILNIARTSGLQAALLTARRELAEAEKAATELTDTPARNARRLELEATLLEAVAAEEKLRAGSDPVELARARTALEQARASLAVAEANLDAANLRAPISGTIIEIGLKVDTLTTANDLVRIADLRSFLIRGQVVEQDVTRLQAGQAVQVQVDSVPGETFAGKLLLVSALPSSMNDPSQGQSDPALLNTSLAGLYPVEIAVEHADPRLRVGMAATAAIEVLSIRDVLTIPLQAVVDGVVQRESGEQVTVELGAVSGDRVEIRAGLAEGDRIMVPTIPASSDPAGLP